MWICITKLHFYIKHIQRVCWSLNTLAVKTLTEAISIPLHFSNLNFWDHPEIFICLSIRWSWLSGYSACVVIWALRVRFPAPEQNYSWLEHMLMTGGLATPVIPCYWEVCNLRMLELAWSLSKGQAGWKASQVTRWAEKLAKLLCQSQRWRVW